VTYEGPSHLSKSESVVSNMILDDINVACKFISDQLTSHNVALKHANFYFKIDEDDELVLIFANNLKLDPFIRISCCEKDIKLTIPKNELEILLSRRQDQEEKVGSSNYMLSGDKMTQKYVSTSLNTQLKLGLSSQMACPFCDIIIEKLGAYEFTLKYLLTIYEFYQRNNMSSSQLEDKLVGEKCKMHQIFNNSESCLNKDIPGLRNNRDLNESEESKSKLISLF